MAKLYISEYSHTPIVGTGQRAPIGFEPNVTNQTPISISGTSAASAAFNAKTKFIRVHTDAICSIKISTAATAATANDARMAINTTEYFGVNPGDVLTVITNT